MLFNELIGFKNNCGVRAALENISYYPYHMHSSILEVVCVLGGKYEISVDAHDHMISYGDVYFFNARNSHKLKKADDNCILLTVHIDLNHYREFFKNFDGSGSYDITDDYFVCDSFRHKSDYSCCFKYLRFLLAKIYTEYSSDSCSEQVLETLAKEFITHILSHYRNYIYARLDSGKYVLVQNVEGTIPDTDRIQRIIDYIYYHFSEKIMLEDLAAMEHLHPNYLSAYIKKTLGLGFTELVSITRCENAEILLGNTVKSLDDIAFEVGFSNRTHLTNQFKKWFSKTPARYRREIAADFSGDSTMQFDTFDYNLAVSILNSYLKGR